MYKVDNGKEVFFRFIELIYGKEVKRVEKNLIKDCLVHFGLPSDDKEIQYWAMQYEEVTS